MTDAREAELLAIIASLTKTIERLTVPRIYGGGGGAGAGFYPAGTGGRGGAGGANVVEIVRIDTTNMSGGGAGAAPFPPHDGSGPDVNPATGDERETTEGEAE